MNRIALFLAFSLSACASDAPSRAADCMAPETLKTITFCAGPTAADQSVANVQAKKAFAAGDESFNPVPVGVSPVLGPADAAVTVVMFTDLQCPFCASAHESVKAVLAKNPDVRLVFKHYPLPFHRAAVPMAIGAITAGEQEKFWEYVDLAYAGQAEVEPATLKEFAEKSGADAQKFSDDFGRQEQLDLVQADVDLGARLGVNGTPTFFINGVRVEGFPGEEEIQGVIDAQRELMGRLKDAGVAKDDLYWRVAVLNYEPLPEEPVPMAEEPPAPTVEVALAPVDGAPVRGAATDDALVTVVVFSDFECPFCSKVEGTLAELREKYPAARFVFRQFPLEFHPNAMPAAIASLVAAEHGKFWEMHDKLFENQRALTTQDLLSYAKDLGIDAKKLGAALESPAYRDRVIEDIKMGAQLGVTGTPSFFINGIKLGGAQPVEAFSELIDAQLTLASQLQSESGLKGDALYEALVSANQALAEGPQE